MHRQRKNGRVSWKKGLTIGLLLLFCFQLGCAQALAAQQANSWYSYSKHQAVTAADLTYQGFDATDLEQALTDLADAYDKKGQNKRIARLIQTVLEEYDELATQFLLAEVAYYRDVHDATRAAEVETLSMLQLELRNQAYAVFAAGMQSSYAEVVAREIGYDYGAALQAYEAMTEKELTLQLQEQQLIQAYDTAYNSSYTVEVDGVTWTEASFAANPPEDEEQYEAVGLALAQKLNALTGEIFTQLVQVRTQIAKEAGYETYADYCYAAYGRDYTPADSKKLYQAVKQSIVPLYQQMAEQVQEGDDEALLEFQNQTGEQILEQIAPTITAIDSELGSTLQFLRQFHLYDLENWPAKMDMAFTGRLPDYGSAFIYAKLDETIQDYSTLIHEFGHFAAMFHNGKYALLDSNDLDVAEIQSQGLEALFCVFGKELFADGGQAFRQWTVLNMLYSIIQGCCQDELQNLVYSHPEMTVAEINRAYYQLLQEYGYAVRPDLEQAYSWVYVHHTFQVPCYYISYATSALSALDLYLKAQNDGARAADRYMKLSALDSFIPYQTAVKICGLQNVFAPGVVAKLAEDLSQNLRLDSPAAKPVRSEIKQLHEMTIRQNAVCLPSAA